MNANDPEVREIRDAHIAIEKEGHYPGYALIDGAYHLLRNLEETVLVVPQEQGGILSWVHSTLNHFENLHLDIQKIIEECVAQHWHENRLDVEYELRVQLTDEYMIFDERRRNLIDAYFAGARSSLYALMRPSSGDWYWIDAPIVFRHAHTDERDSMLEPALKRYNDRYDNALYQAALTSLNVEGTRYETLTANALTDAALYLCGAPYVDARKIYRIIHFLYANPRPVQAYLSTFSS